MTFTYTHTHTGYSCTYEVQSEHRTLQEEASFFNFCFQSAEIRDLTLVEPSTRTQLVLVLLSQLKAGVGPMSWFDSSNVQGRVSWRVTRTPRSPAAWSAGASSRAGRDGSRSTARSSLCLQMQTQWLVGTCRRG